MSYLNTVTALDFNKRNLTCPLITATCLWNCPLSKPGSFCETQWTIHICFTQCSQPQDWVILLSILHISLFQFQHPFLSQILTFHSPTQLPPLHSAQKCCCMLNPSLHTLNNSYKSSSRSLMKFGSESLGRTSSLISWEKGTLACESHAQ